MSEESNLTEKLQEKQSEIKFTEEELTQVQNIQKSYADTTNKFGQLSVAKIRLDQQMTDLEKEEGNLKKEFHELQQKEKNFLKGITDKYGEGTLNPDTGVFTPNSQENKSE